MSQNFSLSNLSWDGELAPTYRSWYTCAKPILPCRPRKLDKILSDDSRGCAAFVRTLGSEKNPGRDERQRHPPHHRLPVGRAGFEDGRILHNLIGEGEYIVAGVDLPLSLLPGRDTS